MAETPKTGSSYTYNASATRSTSPDLSNMSAGTEVRVASYDKNQRTVRVSWADPTTGTQREASVPQDEFNQSFKAKS